MTLDAAEGHKSAASTKAVFICYRREIDFAKWPAQGLAQALRERLGEGDRVFFDTASLRVGNWRHQIDDALERTGVFVVIVGPKWLEEFSRRDPNEDEVLYEIKAALERNAMIVPVTVLGAPQPKRSELPEELAVLNDSEWYTLGEDKLWSSTLKPLVDAIVSELDATPEQRQSRGRRLALVLGVVGLFVLAALLVFLLTRSAPSTPSLSASPAVASTNPDRLTNDLLHSQMSSAVLPKGTSESAPQLGSLSQTGLNAFVYVPLTGPAETIYIDYSIFANRGDASSYYANSLPALSASGPSGTSEKVISHYPLANVGDAAKCAYGRTPASETQGPKWDSVCLLQSDYVVSEAYVVNSKPSSSTMIGLTTDLASSALQNLANVARSAKGGALRAPPVNLSPNSLFDQLDTSFNVPWLPSNYSSPTVRYTTQQGANGLTNGEAIEISFKGPDSSDHFLYWVFDNSQDAAIWFHPVPSVIGSTYTSSFSSGGGFSQLVQCGNYSAPSGTGGSPPAQGISQCAALWGNTVTLASASSTTNLKEGSESNAIYLTRVALIYLGQITGS